MTQELARQIARTETQLKTAEGEHKTYLHDKLNELKKKLMQNGKKSLHVEKDATCDGCQ